MSELQDLTFLHQFIKIIIKSLLLQAAYRQRVLVIHKQGNVRQSQMFILKDLIQLGDTTTENRWVGLISCLRICFYNSAPNRNIGHSRYRKIAASAFYDISMNRVLLHQAVINVKANCIFWVEACSVDCRVTSCPDITSGLATHADISSSSSGLVRAIYSVLDFSVI